MERTANPTLFAEIAVPAADHRSSSGAGVTIMRAADGLYRVRIAGFSPVGGAANVSPLSNVPRFCTIEEEDASGSDLDIWVQCLHLGDGLVMNTAFVLTFQRASGATTAAYSYTLGSVANATHDSGVPDSTYAPHGTVDVHRTGPGDYSVTFFGLDAVGGSLQATSIDSTLMPSCHIVRQARSGNDTVVRVVCRNPTTINSPQGSTQDARFFLTFARRSALRGPTAGSAAYLLADRPTAAAYTPAAATAWSSAAKAPKVTRQGKGRYTVSLPSMPGGGAAIVTSYGGATTGNVCQLVSIASSTPQKVGVKCWTIKGAAADSQFMLSYQK